MENKPCPSCSTYLTVEETEFFTIEICEHCFQHARIERKDDKTCCSKPSIIPVRFITAADTITVRKQCRRCGHLQGSALGGFSISQKNSMPLVDIVKKQKREDYFSNEWRKLNDRKAEGIRKLEEKRLHELRYDYQVYLQSDIWKRKRSLVLKRDNLLCQSCLEKPASEVHHRSYQFVDFTGKEPCFDLMSVCRDCHKIIHEFLNKN